MVKPSGHWRFESPIRYPLLFILCLLVWSTRNADSFTLKTLPSTVSRLFPAGRGFDARYGAANNSTIPDPDEVAARLNVQPYTRLPSWCWKYAWRGHGKMLRILHWRDPAAAKDCDQSLKVVWLKALAAFNPKSPVHDPHRWTYDMLPSVARWLILRLIPPRMYPRLHHANIELRTTYLDKSIEKEIQSLSSANTKIRLISLGAGYDVRSARFLTDQQVDQAFELDIPSVVDSKRIMLERLQRRRQRQHLNTTVLPVCRAVNLNDLPSVQTALEEMCRQSHESSTSTSEHECWHTIFVSEGVLIYLDDTVPGKLLSLCAESIRKTGGTASLCLADRLENSPGGEAMPARQELERAGWNVTDWCPKPGLARHMAVARLLV